MENWLNYKPLTVFFEESSVLREGQTQALWHESGCKKSEHQCLKVRKTTNVIKAKPELILYSEKDQK